MNWIVVSNNNRIVSDGVNIPDAAKSLRASGASARWLCSNALSPAGLRASAGFAKGKTLRKASEPL